MRIQDLNGKNVCVVGYRREGQVLVDAILQHAPQARIMVMSQQDAIDAPSGVATQLGVKNFLQNLEPYDVIVRSGGVGNRPELAGFTDKLTTGTALFFDTIQGTGVRIIGVTGSKGKSTTTTLIYEALRAHDPSHTFLMGNIGIPMFSYLADAKPGNTFVMELSSYMLEDLRVSPNIAVVTSFFPEHLDHHGTVQNYWNAKKHITLHQTQDDAVFYNAIYPQCKEIADASPGTRIAFTADDFPLTIDRTKFKGEHNRSNLAAALKVAEYAGVPHDTALQALTTADPLPHRLQNLGEHGGVFWVNDSFATAPQATIAALAALKDDVDTLIVGGFDRGVSYQGLAEYLDASKVANIVFLPDTGNIISQAMQSHKNTYHTADLKQAVEWAAQHTAKGKTALLSPASPSFNLFKDFVARGEAFADAVASL